MHNVIPTYRLRKSAIMFAHHGHAKPQFSIYSVSLPGFSSQLQSIAHVQLLYRVYRVLAIVFSAYLLGLSWQGPFVFETTVLEDLGSYYAEAAAS